MRCDACGRAWDPPARFCGRCGRQLGPDPVDGQLHGRPGRGDGPGTGRPWSRSGIIAGIVVVLAAGALTLTAVPMFLDGTDRRVPGDVSVPAADPITDVVRAADRRHRPADCSDELQDLPRPVRHYGLYTGRLEWRDGRLCAPVTDPDPDPAPPRCDPPWALVCAIP